MSQLPFLQPLPWKFGFGASPSVHSLASCKEISQELTEKTEGVSASPFLNNGHGVYGREVTPSAQPLRSLPCLL
jgi:hypothetical protein